MVWFEVFIPAREPTLPNVTLTVEAQNWIGALRTGLSHLGEGHEAIANVMCDIKEDNSIHVTDVSSQRVFRLREVAPRVQPAAASSLPPEDTLKHPTSPAPPTEPRAAALPVTTPNAAPLGSASYGGFGDTDVTTPNLDLPAPEAARPAPVHAVPWSETGAPDRNAFDPDPATHELVTAASNRATEALASAALQASPATPRSPMPMPPPAPRAPAAHEQKLPTLAALSEAAAAARAPSSLQKQKPAADFEAADRVPQNPGPSAPAHRSAPKTEILGSIVPRKMGPVQAPTARGTTAPPRMRSSGQFEAAPKPVRRQETAPSPVDAAAIGRPDPHVAAHVIADAVADVFDATQELLLEERSSPQIIASRLLDIALQHVPAESGSFYLADVNGHELRFAAVRGPKAEEIQHKKLSVKVGQGIVGFCALEGVCLSVSDIQKDPRYFSAVADAIGYSPRDTLCASAEKDGRLFGAVQLINSTAGFTPIHMEVLRYIGLTAASLLERHFDNA